MLNNKVYTDIQTTCVVESNELGIEGEHGGVVPSDEQHRR